MTLIEILTTIGQDATVSFRLPGGRSLRLGNGLDPSHADYERTPFFALEFASGKSEGKRCIFQDPASFNSDEWDLVG